MVYLLLFGIFSVPAQQTTVDYNAKYAFPFSFGGEYSSYSPVSFFGTDYGYDFDVIDFAVTLRMPL